jgi:ribosomal protein L11 methyltransferase
MTGRVVDYILDISFDPADVAIEDLIQSRLFLTKSTGNSSTAAVVSAFFDTAEDRDEAAALLADLAASVSATVRDRVDWLEAYEQSLEPILIGERFVVAPDARLIPADSTRVRIIVPQEQAFGTGSHETTSLCIAMLESLDISGKRGLDVGSGSGILAIAMHLLGARKVIAFDNDNDAYGALRDNRMRNHVPDPAMPIFIGGVESLRGGAFDVVTMNIIPEVILPLLGAVVARLANDGVLILSGILIVRADDVIRDAERHGLTLQDARTRGEWWAGRFRT